MPANDIHHNSRATHPRLHIRNAQEAHTLFEAVRLERRLSPTDRELQSGEVFVWEEASYKGGLERWTDGRKWSQSRMREPFLFYEEKAMPSREEKDAKAARRARKSSDPGASPIIAPSSPSPRRQDRPTKVKGLTKQTYSAYVTIPGSTGPPKKWHLTAYFCSSTYHELPVVSEDPLLSKIDVPPGIYVTGKGLTRKNNTRGIGASNPNSQQSSQNVTPAPSVKDFRPSSSLSHHHLSHPYSHHQLPPPSTYSVASTSPTASIRTAVDYHHGHYDIRRPPPPPSDSSATVPATDDGDAELDADGSRSPWSSSSGASMPATPPPHPAGLPAPGPSGVHSYPGHYPSYPPPPQPNYYAPQPQRLIGHGYDGAPVKGPSPVVFDSTPRPASTLPPLRSTPFISAHIPGEEDVKPPVVSAVPPRHHGNPPATPTAYPGPPPAMPPHHPPTYTQYPAQPSPPQSYVVNYPSSDVRGEYYPPSSPPSLASPPSPVGAPSLRYSARHSLDQRALGAFRLDL
ncbi:hypothetical protein FRB99_000096 [Tulasnella sp. 403]|nr:hypothetical protein FRB99_000096 [Tulasnella sp. 403]